MPVFISNGSFRQACSGENDVDGKYKLPDVIDVFDYVCHDQEYRHGIDDEGHKAAEKYSYYHRQSPACRRDDDGSK